MNYKVLCLISLLALMVAADDLYDHLSPVSMFNSMNFAKRVTNNRQKGITIVHFYSGDDTLSSDIKKDYIKFAKDNKGMYGIGGVNCDTSPIICEKEGVTNLPTFRIYPEYPMPTSDLSNENFTIKKLKNRAAKFISDRSIDITSVNHDTFIKDNPGRAKVLLFTESKDTPTIYKALSYNFGKTLFFGIVRSSEPGLAKKYKVKTYPSVFLVKPGEAARKFDGEMKYYDISTFINVYSEVFDFGDVGKPQVESAASKTWMSERLPQLHKDSSKDICFGKKGLCVILMSKETPSDALIDAISTVRESFISNLDGRGIAFSFMWIDVNLHTEWPAIFDVTEFPQVIVLNHGSKNKFMKHTEELVTESSLSKLLNTIVGGNGRFKKVENNQLPSLLKIE